MTKAKINALEALRALIAERQQYEQWISVLESKRDSTPAHVFEKVHGDYNTRLQRVVTDIKGHAEELQLSISTLASRLVEVAREEETRRDALQEAELRAAVGEFEPQQWDQLRSEAERGLEKVAGDRASLDSQLGELRSIQKLSEVGSIGDVEPVVTLPVLHDDSSTARDMMAAEQTSSAASPVNGQQAEEKSAEASTGSKVSATDVAATASQQGLPFDRAASGQSAPVATPAAPVEPPAQARQTPGAAPASAPTPPGGQRPRTGKTPPFGGVAAKPKAPEPRVDQTKTLKCPECGAPNYMTEWYCERCGGELATM
jgi:hypothetical protein